MAGGHLLGNLADHEHQTVSVVGAEVAALLKTWVVLRYYLTFLALVATAELAVVHRHAVMPSFVAKFLLAWR